MPDVHSDGRSRPIQGMPAPLEHQWQTFPLATSGRHIDIYEIYRAHASPTPFVCKHNIIFGRLQVLGAARNNTNITPPRKIPHCFSPHSISEVAACLDGACATLRSMTSCTSGRSPVKPYDLSRCKSSAAFIHKYISHSLATH